MNLYWFHDNPDGHFWAVIAAKDVESAWHHLALSQHADSVDPNTRITVEEVKEKFVLCAATEIDGTTEGEVATSFPLECRFDINQKPGGTLSTLTNY